MVTDTICRRNNHNMYNYILLFERKGITIDTI
nr:MAG TPA: hypothetical protein [Bacteriophage sp.]